MANLMLVVNVPHALQEHSALPVLLLVPIVQPIKYLLPALVPAWLVLMDKVPRQYVLRIPNDSIEALPLTL